MTVNFTHTYTDPPQRISTELSGGGAAQDLFPRVQVLPDHLPEPGPARTITDGEREQLALHPHGSVAVIRTFVDSVRG